MITRSDNGGITNPACRPARFLRYSTRRTTACQRKTGLEPEVARRVGERLTSGTRGGILDSLGESRIFLLPSWSLACKTFFVCFVCCVCFDYTLSLVVRRKEMIA